MGDKKTLTTKKDMEGYVDSAFSTLLETHRSLLEVENKIDDILTSKKTDVPTALMSLGTDISDIIDALEEKLGIDDT